MILRRIVAATAVGLYAAATGASAAPPVTVTAKPPPSRATLNHDAANFVDAIAVQPEGESLIRWGRPICPYAVGLGAEARAALAQEIAQVAHAAGAPVATTDCAPNFVLVASEQPAVVLAAWRNREPDLFGDALPADVDQFLADGPPVRVWYNALRSSVDGEAIAKGPQIYSGMDVVYSYGVSRLRFKTVLGLESVIVAVDLRRARGLTIRQIADYAAMAGLAEIKLNADLGAAPTILRLFQASAAERPAGMTEWDRGFLAGVYASDQASKIQRSAIAASVSAATAANPATP
ncbi:MAG TPA: hypothetical protein VKT30_10285 [Caulobacteraceae bacterium]|nr:hypothetical protein [Caulobacteraceae bacterium]